MKDEQPQATSRSGGAPLKESVRASGILLAGSITSKALRFASDVLVGRVLGPTGFGIIAAAMSLVGILGEIALLGTQRAALRFASLTEGDNRSLVRRAMLVPICIGGVLAAVIPVVAGFVTQGIPPPPVVVGIVLAIVAVILVSRVAGESGGRDGLAEALVGGTAIGLFGVAIAQLSPGDLFADLTTIRFVQGALVVAVVLVTRAAWRPGSLIVPLVLIGLLDTVGNALYLAAVQTGQLAIASVLSAMYPVATVILAAVVLREPITRDHSVGIGLAAAAIALISLGGA